MTASSPSATGSPGDNFWQRFSRLMGQNPAETALAVATFVVILAFYQFYEAFFGGNASAFAWLGSAWNPETDYMHGWLAPLIMLYLLWRLRERFLEVPKAMSSWGIPLLLAGIFCYALSVRMLQPRVAIGAFPLILLGVILLFWGKETAKLAAFPLLFIWLVIPIPSLQQATSWLQGFIADCVSIIVGVFGIHVHALGADLISEGANDFKMQVAGGCSGVRSLMAMSMLAALYVYFTQNRLWKQIVIFGGTLIFTLIGNIARVSSIVLIAAAGFEDFATGWYHDYSVFIIFFPVALATMVGFAWVVNRDYTGLWKKATTPSSPPPKEPPTDESTY